MQQLNFAKSPFRNDRLPSALYGLAAATLLAVTVIHGITLTRYLLREQEELDVKVEVLQKEQADLDARIRRTQSELDSQRNEARAERIRFLATIYRQKGFSWTGLFNELESLTPGPVRITSIAPGPGGGKEDENQEEIEIQLQVVARSREDVLEMIRRLEKNRYLTTVLPRSESEEIESGGIAATLTLQYRRPEEDTAAAEAPSSARREQTLEGNKEAGSPVSQETDTRRISAVTGER